MASTVYDVRLRYLMEDRASRGMDRLTKASSRASSATSRVSHGLGRLVALGAGFLTFRAASKALIGYNSEMQQARTTTAAMLGLFGSEKGSSFTSRLQVASNIMEELKQRSAKSTATTQEMVAFMNQTNSALSRAGLHSSEIASFTADAVVAAKSLNLEGIAALDIEQALMKGVSVRDRFAKTLLDVQGVSLKQFNAMNNAQKLGVLQTALQNKEFKKLAELQAKTFAGQFSTIKDRIQQTLAKVGLPLFEAITAQLQKWNTWLEKNQATVTRWAKDFGRGLISGAKAIRDAIGWMVQHKGLVMALASAFAGLKVANTMSGIFGPVISGFQSLSPAMQGVVGKFGMVGAGLGAFYVALKGIAHVADKRQDSQIRGKADFESTKNLLEKANKGSKGAARALFSGSGATFAGKSQEQIEAIIRDISAKSAKKDESLGQFLLSPMSTQIEAAERTNHLLSLLPKAMAEATRGDELVAMRDFELSARRAVNQKAKEASQQMAIEEARKKAQGTNKQTNMRVTINRMEVQSDDPDRFVFQLQSSIDEATRQPVGGA